MVVAEMEDASSATTTSARRRGRQVALQVLYAADLGRGKASELSGSEVISKDPQEVFDQVASHFEMPAAARAFALAVVLGVREGLESIDAQVTAHSENWRLDRMAVVDRNILRLGTWELMETDTPVPVILDEAIDLARRFADETSTSFVNGILDAIARTTRGRG